MPGARVIEHVLSVSRALGSIPLPKPATKQKVGNTIAVTAAFFILEEASLKTGLGAPPCGLWSKCHLYQQSSTIGGEKIFKSFYNPVEFLFLIFQFLKISLGNFRLSIFVFL